MFLSLGFLAITLYKNYHQNNQRAIVEQLEQKQINDNHFNLLYEEALENDYHYALFLIATHSQCPEKILSQLAKSEYITLRRAVAFNEFCNVNILIKLSSDKSSNVRSAVASNKSLPLDILERMQNDSDQVVRDTALAMLQARKLPIFK